MRQNVLVSVLKSKEDLRILLQEKWYRIPSAFLPRRRFTHIAFYQPQTGFGKSGKRIEYYARVVKREAKKRIVLLPREPLHPRAREDYLKCSFRKIEKLDRPIRNIIPRRVSFGFTTLKALRSARDILELYGVPKTEQIVERALTCLGIPTAAEFSLSRKAQPSESKVEPYRRKRFRLDIAIFCKKGDIAIECDNRKAHSGRLQKLKDHRKDAALRRLGWRVVRLTESDIVEHLDDCIRCIQESIRALGGIL